MENSLYHRPLWQGTGKPVLNTLNMMRGKILGKTRNVLRVCLTKVNFQDQCAMLGVSCSDGMIVFQCAFGSCRQLHTESWKNEA